MATTKVSFDFPSDAWPGICNAFADAYQWPAQISVDGVMQDNPETKQDFTVRKVMEFVGNVWADFARKALKTAQDQLNAEINIRQSQVMVATTKTITEV